MTRDDVQQIVLGALATTNLARGAGQQVRVAPDAVVFGQGSPLDSLGLVGLLIDIEDVLGDRGVHVALSDARAMSQTRSPFRDVPSLVAYISDLLEQRR
jgi:hypothetical protein